MIAVCMVAFVGFFAHNRHRQPNPKPKLKSKFP